MGATHAHTPGPWRGYIFDKRSVCHIQSADLTVAIVYGVHQPAKANARLICAAPDLLAAAQAVLAGLEARIDAAPTTDVPVFDGIADLRDAIKKATCQ